MCRMSSRRICPKEGGAGRAHETARMSVDYTTPGKTLARVSLQDRRIAEEFASVQPSSAAWATWSPTVTKTGAGTYTVTGTPVYKYRLNYPEVFFYVDLHGTVAGVITAVSLTLPTLSSGTIPAVNHHNVVILDWAGGFAVGKCVISNTAIVISEYTGANWAVGTSGMHPAIVRAEIS